MFAVGFFIVSCVPLCCVISQPTIDYASSCSGIVTVEDEIQQLRHSLEEESQRTKTFERLLSEKIAADAEAKEKYCAKTTARNRTSVSVSLIKRLLPSSNSSSGVYGIAKAEDEVYVMWRGSRSIRVFDDRNDFSFLREILIPEIGIPHDLVYSNRSKCFYIADFQNRCIWKLTASANSRQLTKWLSNIMAPCTLSLTRDENVLIVKNDSVFRQIEIYGMDANLKLSLRLPEEIKDPRHVVQTSRRTFIICHQKLIAADSSKTITVITELTTEGEIVSQFYPMQKLQEMNTVFYLCIVSTYDLLLVGDTWNHRIIALDERSLNWFQVLTSTGDNTFDRPFRLFYDESRRHLLVGHWESGHLRIAVNQK